MAEMFRNFGTTNLDRIICLRVEIDKYATYKTVLFTGVAERIRGKCVLNLSLNLVRIIVWYGTIMLRINLVNSYDLHSNLYYPSQISCSETHVDFFFLSGAIFGFSK